MSDNRRPIVAVDARVLAHVGQGVPRFLYETLREMIQLGDVTPILISNRPLHPSYQLDTPFIYDASWHRVPGSLWMLLRLNRLARRQGADIVWGPIHTLPFTDRPLKSVLTLHDLVHHIMPQSMQRWNRIIARLLVDRSVRRSDRVVADSETTRADMATLIGRSVSSTDVVYLATRPLEGDFSHAPSAEPYLFTLGSIEPRKNIDGLLDCFLHLREAMPQLRLKLSGAHQWGAVKTLERLNPANGCDNLGFLTDQQVGDTMSASCAFVMPSHYEGFGLPVIEAVGRAPIIVSDIPIFRELGHTIDGIHFVDFKDPQRAASHIAEILATNPPAAQFKPGFELEFRWQRVAERYTKIFKELTEQTIP